MAQLSGFMDNWQQSLLCTFYTYLVLNVHTLFSISACDYLGPDRVQERYGPISPGQTIHWLTQGYVQIMIPIMLSVGSLYILIAERKQERERESGKERKRKRERERVARE